MLLAGPAKRCVPRHADALPKRLQINGQRAKLVAPVRALTPFAEAAAHPVDVSQASAFPAASGVYAVLDNDGVTRYVGISRTISLSVTTHAKELGPDVVAAVKWALVENATKDDLVAAWKEWLQQCVDASGQIPSGNAPGPEKERWQARRPAPAAKPEIKLTSGKGLADVTVDVKELIDMVVKNEKVVVFIKGTRTSPQCGFSFNMLTHLNSLQADYQVVNVLDEVYNPGLREAIKEYSAWPTIPQLYVGGEFVGGSDIVSEMMSSGELAKLLKSG